MTFFFRMAFTKPHLSYKAISIIVIILFLQGCNSSKTKPWLSEHLTEEFTTEKAEDIKGFADYVALEDRLFKELDEKIYVQRKVDNNHSLERYTLDSAADFHNQQPNWNRSFEFKTEQTRGAVLLLHGMSDSPYSLRTLGKALNDKGYWVIGLRLPGHGTAPSGLRYIDRQDMTAAVQLVMTDLGNKVGEKPIHIIGYSTGASLALEYTLDSLEGKSNPQPAKLVLISPAIGVHPSASLAGVKNSLSNIPGLNDLAFLQILPEFDPYKYNSFATNAGDVVFSLTRSVARRIKEIGARNTDIILPPILVIKSTVDATVTNESVVNSLFNHLKPKRHELILFDINRYAMLRSKLLVDDPAPFTDRIMQDKTLPFTVTFVTNENPQSIKLVAKTKLPFTDQAINDEPLGLSWPTGVISLSHVALPISPLDQLYGQRPPENNDFIFLGQMAVQGERGLLKISADWMLRLRYNPFYDFVENRTIKWIED